MRFGHFFYPMKFDDSRDGQEIQACLDEAQLVEELGMDAIWFAEHYFTGEVVYGDPLVFASAVAVKTKKIMLGFGILELPLHNPVRVAIQTALLDNLCQGRLVVGTGRGSNYNAYEYVGFGTSTGLGAAQLDEAEELLIKAWTEDNVKFEGEFFNVSFPSVRPRPYQKPHPPLARACTGDASLMEMAKIGRPVGPAPTLPEAPSAVGPGLHRRRVADGDGQDRPARLDPGQLVQRHRREDQAVPGHHVGGRVQRRGGGAQPGPTLGLA